MHCGRSDRLIQLDDQFADLGSSICRRWLSVGLIGVEGVLQKKAGILDQSELGVLIVWNKTLQR